MPNLLNRKYLWQVGLLWTLVLLLVSLTEAQATHIRAGDITAVQDTTPIIKDDEGMRGLGDKGRHLLPQQARAKLLISEKAMHRIVVQPLEVVSKIGAGVVDLRVQ